MLIEAENGYSRSKKGRFSKAGVVSRGNKIGELKTGAVKDKPLIHTAEENKNEPHYHNVSSEKLFEGSRITDLLFVIKQLKDGCTVCGELQNIVCICDNHHHHLDTVSSFKP